MVTFGADGKTDTCSDPSSIFKLQDVKEMTDQIASNNFIYRSKLFLNGKMVFLFGNSLVGEKFSQKSSGRYWIEVRDSKLFRYKGDCYVSMGESCADGDEVLNVEGKSDYIVEQVPADQVPAKQK